MASLDQWTFYASQFLESEALTEEANALQEKLSLYQVFLKLYEHRRELLNDILRLERGELVLPNVKLPYVQGTILREPYLVTNLLTGKTEALFHADCRWTIGRHPLQATIGISDDRLSRVHAAIEYVAQQGFYLTDLNSLNGTFVNGEPVHQPILLQDGDRVRMGNLCFVFFLCNSTQVLASGFPSVEYSTPITYSPFSITASAECYVNHLHTVRLEPDQLPVTDARDAQEATFSLM
ncbi:FHA domain-containing protein [Leptolyngbya ohadii]|uniref:FHA domain-containing protein n=1 Tax=Leptolyngbya ohadii TaxID=1962290 RepID=UPI000B59DCE0|nr:FHA domain-containing protein [Leptolyngbya ohadii]